MQCADKHACEKPPSDQPPAANPLSSRMFGLGQATLEKWRTDCRRGLARVAQFAGCEQWLKRGRDPKRKGGAEQPELPPGKRPRVESPRSQKASRLQARLRSVFQRAPSKQNPGPHELARDPHTPATNPLVPSPPQRSAAVWPARISSAARNGLPRVGQEQVHKGRAMSQTGRLPITHAHRCAVERDPRIMVEKATWTEKEFRWLDKARRHVAAKSAGLAPAPSPWGVAKTKHDVDSLSREALIGSVLSQLPTDGGRHHFLFPAYVQHRPAAKLVNHKTGRVVPQFGIYTPFAPGRSYWSIALAGWTDAAQQYHGPLDGDESLAVQLQVAFAIAIMHERAQVIHTDLHSSNVLVQTLPQPASFQYVVHGADGMEHSFAFWSRHHVVVFDWDRAVFVPTAPPVDQSALCAAYGQCQSERTYVVDEYKFWSSPAPYARFHRYVADYVVPVEEMRPVDSLFHFLCFGHYAVNATAPDASCTRCTPTPAMVQDALSLILDPGSPFATFRGAFAHPPLYLTNVYQYGDSRDPTQPVCSPAIWNKPRRALTQ